MIALTAGTRVRRGSLGRLAAVLIAAALLAGCGITHPGGGRPDPHPPAAVPTSAAPSVAPLVLKPLIDPHLDLSAGPVDVPLKLRIPSIGVSASVLGVGMTSKHLMDAPTGSPADPVWGQAFWYRGSGLPGDSGTATIAGHLDDVLGRPAVFARLKELQAHDLIIVHDTRSGLDARFTVTETDTYSGRQASEPTVLARVYGPGPVAGIGPQPAPGGRSYLTLITCAGDYVGGSYDHRLVVYAQRNAVDTASTTSASPQVAG